MYVAAYAAYFYTGTLAETLGGESGGLLAEVGQLVELVMGFRKAGCRPCR